MKLTFRSQILLTLLPLLVLLAALGGAGCVLLSRLGNRIDIILRENYDSVLYMERFGEALERIDSSFTFALAGREKLAQAQYEEYWQSLRGYLDKELNNITLPGEQQLVDRLANLSTAYRKQGDAFYMLADIPGRNQAYFGETGRPGLYDSFKEMKVVSGQIRRINQEAMEEAGRDARLAANSSLIWFGVGLAIVSVLALMLAVHTVRALLHPIRSVTESALAIGAGHLDQVVPVVSGDELGRLAGAFNTMARQLRAYRQSQQAQMLRLQNTTQAAIDSFPHPVLVVDPEGQVELANPAARRALGVLVGEPRSQLPWQPPEQLREPLRRAFAEQRPYLPEDFSHAVALRTGNEERFFLPRILPIRDPEGTTLGAAVLLKDVTRFRLLDEVKTNLVATVSHELKTPLTSIRLAIHLLLEENVGPLTAKQLELLLDARDNAERLLAMINNLLDLGRLQQGPRRLELRPEQPVDLLRTVADYVRPRAEDKGVKLLVTAETDLPRVGADEGQLGHALENLLDNALRFTSRGGSITMSAAAQDGTVRVSLADTGAGILAEYLPHIFDRFFRVPGQNQEPGTGLGLAIVREIVTAHGGTVSVESQVGKGTTFHLTLPIWSEELKPLSPVLRGEGLG